MRYFCIFQLLLAGCAQPNVTWNPPRQFDQVYEGELLTTQESFLTVSLICDMILNEGKGQYYGCAIEQNGVCIVFLMDAPQDGIQIGAVLRHEIGHCNGWSANHQPQK